MTINHSTIAPFYDIRAKECATLLHCRAGQNMDCSKAEPQNGGTKLNFIRVIINPLFDGLTYIRADILLIAHIFPRPEKYYATRKISARIIC